MDHNRAIEEARKALSAIELAIDTEVRAARDAINQRYATQLEEARKAVRDAEQAKRDHIDRAASHPWDGKRVYRDVQRYHRWSNKPTHVEREEGIVEVVRQSSEFPDNMRFAIPALGTAIVRKLRKDGTVSKQFHKTWGQIENVWTLAE